ncbi:Golgin subfamily A member 7/ERF4 [Plasmopara halstedii]|uniref:Golgin subfamily A member 7/ERF4 n=1 Tax=Plasmopara halstedii TaxID=4781 RepID=A0A0P1AI81_PLAHL|nr:Golgin subfamily A member 7/ERF4 [Plasmopara halstedii]CEG40200.1 Golgin subfamily A member 7/ERF4 [Plasmopara halstedii]|eukprot:XP_024576569.1 Golgin subfamily A member 7/ERF4 [Plasmopara halstedii]
MAALNSPKLLAVLRPTGDIFVNGLSSGYDDNYPESEQLRLLMTRDDFATSVAMINDALLDHWPCLPCTGFGYGCCICTLGLSLYCASTQVAEAESRLQLQLRRMNEQTKFKEKGIQWRLKRSWWKRTSYIEIVVNANSCKSVET